MECTAIQSNSILVVQSISKLTEKIKGAEDKEPDLKILMEKCFSNDDTISLAASEALVYLVKNKVFPINSILSDLVSAIPVTKSHLGVTIAVCDLLELYVQFQIKLHETYESSYNLYSPKHPLISILSCHKNSFPDIFTKIKQFYQNDCDSNYYGNELLYSFYIYVLCSPRSEIPDSFQYKLWNYLLQIDGSQSVKVLPYLIAWMQLSTKEDCLKASGFLIELLNTKCINEGMKEVAILWLTSLLHEVLINRNNPRDIIICLCEAISTNILVKRSSSSILTILTQCISICPSVYLQDLLTLCKRIIMLNYSNKFSLHCLKVALLQWLAIGCILTESPQQTAKQLLLYIENNKEGAQLETKELYCNRLFHFLKSTNRIIDLSVELNCVSESLTDSNVVELLSRVYELSPHLLRDKFYLFTAMLLYDNLHVRATLKIIQILLKIADTCKETMLELLTLFLYKLSHSKNPEIIFAVLKALPKMAAIKENVPVVINTLEILKKGMFDLNLFAVTLFYDLWELDTKYFMYLSNVLNSICESTLSNAQWWEVYATKAFILKKISLKKPEVHGRELVGHISEILNKCNQKEGAVPLALAIDSIKLLYNSGIIDISSTWDEIGPRFHSETNVLIIKSLCSLMSEVAYCDPNEYSEKLLEDIFTKLWSYAAPNNDVEIISSAYKAIACFSMEQVACHLPSKYKSANDEMILGMLHGKCWLTLLQDYKENNCHAVGDFLIKFVSNEISQYRSGAYKVEEGQREPQDFNYLPNHSIVRALGNYLRRMVQSWQTGGTKHVYVECLRILSQEYTKPLPPADWCFLQELVHFDEIRLNCVKLASHQLQLSGTARRFMENYIMALTNLESSSENIKIIVQNLKYLCNAIQPVILQPFLENSVTYALESDSTILELLIDNFKIAFTMKHLHEANKLILSQIIVNLASQIDNQTELFTKLQAVIVLLPTRFINQLLEPLNWRDETEKEEHLAIQIQCAVALRKPMLNSLNIFLAADYFRFNQYQFILKNISEVMYSSRTSDKVINWVIELLGNIQSMIANEHTTKMHLHFLCDVFIISVIILAGHDWFCLPAVLLTSPEERLNIFPQSVLTLLKTDRWKFYGLQISEWLHHMITNEPLHINYKVSFYQTLAALRHEEVVMSGLKWMKYLGILPSNVAN